MKKSYFTTRRIATIAIMSAIAAVLMVFDFPLTFIAPSFYKLDVSDLPCLIGSFALGPVSGIIIEFLKILIKLVIKPTSTAFVGELANFACGVALCVPAALVYKNNHSKKGALLGLILGALSISIVGSLFNYLIMIPFYVKLYNMPLEVIISAGSAIIPAIKDKFSFVLLCVAPFNLIKGIIVSTLTYFLYKRISPLLKDTH